MLESRFYTKKIEQSFWCKTVESIRHNRAIMFNLTGAPLTITRRTVRHTPKETVDTDEIRKLKLQVHIAPRVLLNLVKQIWCAIEGVRKYPTKHYWYSTTYVNHYNKVYLYAFTVLNLLPP